MSRLALYLLGPPRVELDGEPIQIPRRKAAALLAYLAITGQSHSRDSLTTLLWPEYDQSGARAELRRNLSVLRKAVGGEWLVVDQEIVGTDPDADFWLDVDQFRQRLAVCGTHGHPPMEPCPDCVPLLEEAVGLYRDDFLAGFTLRDSPGFDEFQFFQTEGLRDELASALLRLANTYASQGDFEPAIEYARRWLALDPLHEPAHRCLMQLYAQAGQWGAALRQYRECVRILEEELKLPPTGEITALYERIRAERARLAERDAVLPAPTPPHPASAQLPSFLGDAEPPAAVERPVFVARERELALLNAFLETALAGKGQVVFVTGDAGRGKTALMREFTRRAMEAHSDLLVAGGNCNAYSGIGDQYLPFREALGMLTGDVEARWAAGTITRDHAQRLWTALPLVLQAMVDHGPFLIGTVVPGAALLSRSAAVASEGCDWLELLKALSLQERTGASDLAQSALFEQVANVLRAVAAEHPLLLLLDDLQWADIGSIGLLFHLGRRLEEERILIMGAYRPEEVALGRDGQRHPLRKVLTEFKRRFGDVQVDLTRADETEGRSFVDGFLDSEPNRLEEDFRRGLFQHTGGHPLFTIEVLRAMQEQGDLVQDEEGRWVEGAALDWGRLPAQVEAVIEERVGRLDEELRDMLAVASVEGERFTAQVVAQVQDLPEREVLRALSQELGARHRLVREGEELRIDGRFLSRYQFAHALFQEYLYRALSSGERRLLHGEVAAALEGLYGDQTAEIVAQLAHHYTAAGQQEKAIEYSLRAGDQAHLAYANEEAIAYFHRALGLLDGSPPVVSGAEPLGGSRKGWRLEVLRGLGQVCYGTGKMAEAEERFQEAISLGREIELAPRELVRLYYWLAGTLWWQDRFDDLIRIGEEGLALLGDDVESVEAALMIDAMALGHYWSTGNMATFRESTLRTAHLIERLPYSSILGPAYHHVIKMYVYDKDVEEVLKWVQALEERATAHRDLRALGEAHASAGYLLAWTGDLHSSVSRYRQGLELLTRIGDAALESAWLEIVGRMAFLSLGDLEKVEECAGRLLETTRVEGFKRGMAAGHELVGLIALCRGGWGEAVDAFQKSIQRFQEAGDRIGEGEATYSLGQAYLAQEDRRQALKRFQGALALAAPEELRGYLYEPLFSRVDFLVAGALSGLEAAYADRAAFRTFCRRFRQEHPEVGDAPFVQWFLEPTEPQQDCGLQIADCGWGKDDFEDLRSQVQNGEWVWEDPFGDCSFTVHNGLEIHAANGRDLWYINWSAPRMLRLASGDLAAQTVCTAVSDGKPAIGGLLLWKDRENYLRLDRGAMGEHDVFFGACLENQDVIIGRGRLPFDESANQQISKSSGRVFLRLERIGDRVDALCSADGEHWFTVGHVGFPIEESVQIGLHAIGSIDRAIYHGAYPAGTAIRFESFQLWGLDG